MSAQPANGPWTVARLIGWTREFFERNQIESPRLCAEILLAHAMRCRRLELYTRFEQVPAAEVLAAYRGSVKEAAAGKPIAYLTGTRDFFSLTFEVTPDVLVPRPETEILVERVVHLARPPRPAAPPADEASADPREAAAAEVAPETANDAPAGGKDTAAAGKDVLVRAKDAPAKDTPLAAKNAPVPAISILDIGTGSGCIAVALAKNLPGAAIAASDISEASLAVARRNAVAHGAAERIEFRCGDLAGPWANHPPFDIIISNPPYIGTREAASLPHSVRDFEPHAALFAGDDGLAVLRRLAVECAARLRPGGHLLVEVAYNQAAAVKQLFAAAGWVDIQTYRDDQRYERVVHARRK